MMKKLVADDETHRFGPPKMDAFCDFPPPGSGMVMAGRPWFEGAGRRRLLLKIPRAGIGFTKIVPNKYESSEVTNFFHVWIF